MCGKRKRCKKSLLLLDETYVPLPWQIVDVICQYAAPTLEDQMRRFKEMFHDEWYQLYWYYVYNTTCQRAFYRFEIEVSTIKFTLRSGVGNLSQRKHRYLLNSTMLCGPCTFGRMCYDRVKIWLHNLSNSHVSIVEKSVKIKELQSFQGVPYFIAKKDKKALLRKRNRGNSICSSSVRQILKKYKTGE